MSIKNFFIFGLSLLISISQAQEKFTLDDINHAQKLIGLDFSQTQRDSLQDELEQNLSYYQQLREVRIDNWIPPALRFEVLPVGFILEKEQKPIKWSEPGKITLSKNLEELAFYPLRDLAELIRTGKISSLELTRMYLKRLKKYDPRLHCVITLTEDLALAQAKQADAEIADGKYRGLLHGIPYGAKDLLAVKGYKTTWGSVPFKDQYLDQTATVIKKLEEAGAVLLAKLTLGELAWGDVWYGEMTRNPWNLEQGSSGSSAGSAAATSAGLVAFAIGSETWGSIVSPSTRCGTTGLRPTYGRISRNGAMALSWSMDKLGPICRTVEDCAIVFNAIRGSDGMDQTILDVPFNYQSQLDIKKLRIGFLKSAFAEDTVNQTTNQETLLKLQTLGISLIPVELPDLPVSSMSIILSAESAAAFDELTRSGRDSLLIRQIKDAWPNVFRASRFIPAVEYIQANRLRYQLIQQMDQLMKQIDVYLTPSFGTNLLLTNLSGHPCVVLPNGFNEQGTPNSICFIGRLFGEAELLAVAKTYQQATTFHQQYPPLFR